MIGRARIWGVAANCHRRRGFRSKNVANSSVN